MFKKKSTTLLLVAFLIIALLDITFVVLNQRMAYSAFESALEDEAQALRRNFDSLISHTYKNMQSLATYIANDPDVQQAFLEGKNAIEHEGGGAGKEQAAIARKKLLSLVERKWKKVQEKFSGRQLHFHLGPGSTSFLRVHKPEKFGDNMDSVRFTVVDTNKYQTPRTGFETGKVYSGLRGIVPVFANTEGSEQDYIGALEVGRSFDMILNILAQSSHYEVGVLLSKYHVVSTMWPDAIVNRFGADSVDRDCFIEATTSDFFEQIINAGREKGIHFRDGGNELISVGKHNYMITYFPLRDYLGSLNSERESVGAVIFWNNVDKKLAALERRNLYNIIYGIIGFVLIGLAFYVVFGLTTIHLKNQIRDASYRLSRSKDRLTLAQQVAQVSNWEWNIKTGKIWWSDQTYAIFGLDKASTSPNYDLFLKHVHPEDASDVKEAIEKALSDGSEYSVVHRIITPTGQQKHVRERGFCEFDSQGEPLMMYGTMQDITSERNHEFRYEEILKATKAGTWEWDLDFHKMEVNSHLATVLKIEKRQISVQDENPFKERIYSEDYSALLERITQVVKQECGSIDIDIRMMNAEDEWIWVHVDGQVLERTLAGRAIKLVGTTVDISKRKNAELEVQYLATMDSLTGLYNRLAFHEKLSELVTLSKRTERSFSLMLLDLDGFKHINDSYGHPVGDQVLNYVGQVLKEVGRESDIIARLGGDEFAIIMPTVTDNEGCIAFANRVIDAFSEPVVLSERNLAVKTSIGYYLYDDFDVQPKAAIEAADKALYAAKENGKNTFSGYFKH